MRVTAALALTLLLAGCSALSQEDEAGTGPRVVVSFYPLQYIAERVAGDQARVTNLTAPGQEPHDLELSIRQVAKVDEADLAFYLEGFQPGVDEVIEQNTPDHVLEVSEKVDLAAGEEHAGETEEEHAEHGDTDPHFWLDPLKMSAAAEAFTDELSTVDPDRAEEYAANLADLQGDLEQLDQEYVDGLARCALDTVVVSHDAFGYLERYGLHFEAIAGLSPDAEPSPGRLAELQRVVRDTGVTTVFSESLASPALAETLAEDLGIEVDVLDPIEGLIEDGTGEDYLSLMRWNLQGLQAANGCR
jgi:zinc transport system substrate-binding protein